MAEEIPAQSGLPKSLRPQAEEMLRAEPEVTPTLPTTDVKTLLYGLSDS